MLEEKKEVRGSCTEGTAESASYPNSQIYTLTASARRRAPCASSTVATGHTCMAFRDTPTACGDDTLAQRYEITMSRLERITQAGYQVKIQWECEFELPEDMDVVESNP